MREQKQARSLTAIPESQRWNRNIHYHPLLLDLGPAERALDVGCGGGMLTRQLAASCDEVVGLDVDEPSIVGARAATTASNVSYELGDVLAFPFETESFDLVVSVAMIHHIDARDALRRFAELLRPGGRLGVIGIGRSTFPRDFPRVVVSGAATQISKLVKRRQIWDHSAPMVWPPPSTESEMQTLGADVLPGSIFQRRLHGRYSLMWTKPKIGER